jgi:hypothetical protein
LCEVQSFLWFVGYLLMYVQLRFAIRNNDIAIVNSIWQASWPLFKATNKNKYAFLSMYTTFVLKFGAQPLVSVLNNRLVSLKGYTNHFIGPDTVTEKINLVDR